MAKVHPKKIPTEVRLLVKLDPQSVADIAAAVADSVNQRTEQLFTQGEAMNAATQAAVDRLVQEVSENTDAASAAEVAMNGLAAQIAALKVGQEDPAVLAALDAAAEIVDSNTKRIAAAIVANATA